MSVIELRGVRRGYGGEPVLDGLDLAVAPGEVVGLLGCNGAGKTTLIRLVMGMLAPEAGQVRVFGQDPGREPVAVRRRIGYVAEDQELPAFLKVAEVLAMYRRLFPGWDDAEAGALLERFRLPAGRRIRDLSKGQARQVALMCAISHRPELLILDEPAGGLDPAARREFLETSIRLLNETGTTILFSSHHMGDVERMASRLVMIHEAQKWIDSSLDDIREGYSLAQVPADALAPERLLAVPECLCVRRHGEALHAVLALPPEAGSDAVAALVGTPPLCRVLPLEEMFIELVGREP